MEYYECIDHTADVGIRVRGATLAALFAHTGQALFALLVDASELPQKGTNALHLEADDLDELMFFWVRRLLSDFNSDSWVYLKFDVSMKQQTSLRAQLPGYQGDIPQELLREEIKAVTYHDLHVREEHGIWQAQLIFDV